MFVDVDDTARCSFTAALCDHQQQRLLSPNTVAKQGQRHAGIEGERVFGCLLPFIDNSVVPTHFLLHVFI